MGKKLKKYFKWKHLVRSMDVGFLVISPIMCFLSVLLLITEVNKGKESLWLHALILIIFWIVLFMDTIADIIAQRNIWTDRD